MPWKPGKLSFSRCVSAERAASWARHSSASWTQRRPAWRNGWMRGATLFTRSLDLPRVAKERECRQSAGDMLAAARGGGPDAGQPRWRRRGADCHRPVQRLRRRYRLMQVMAGAAWAADAGRWFFLMANAHPCRV